MKPDEMSVIAVDYRHVYPHNVFRWLEELGFKRYGVNYNVDPKERDDPRYPAETDESPSGWYTHLAVPSWCYDKTMFIIDAEVFEKIKEHYHSSVPR